MNLTEIATRVGRSKRTIMRMVDARTFPKWSERRGRLITWDPAIVERWCKRHVRRRGGKTDVDVEQRNGRRKRRARPRVGRNGRSARAKKKRRRD